MDVSLLAEQRRNGHMLLGRTGAHEVSLSASVKGPFQLRLPAGIKAHNICVLGPSPSFLFVLLAVLGPMARPEIQGTFGVADLGVAVWPFFWKMALLVRLPVAAVVVLALAASFFLFFTVSNSASSFSPLMSSNDN